MGRLCWKYTLIHVTFFTTNDLYALCYAFCVNVGRTQVFRSRFVLLSYQGILMYKYFMAWLRTSLHSKQLYFCTNHQAYRQ